jgi:hypothetical protein
MACLRMMLGLPSSSMTMMEEEGSYRYT